MLHGKWRKHLVLWRNRLYLYPPPDPLSRTKAYYVATCMVALLVLLFSAYFILYLTGRYNAYSTNAEDLGIMDQAIWNTLHGNLLHQSICNIVSDTNCYNYAGISRLAIHFEPILFPIALLYLICPDPKTLLVLQTIVVALGAFPAFWLARLRLRNELAAVAIALLYLLYPALQNALVFDFHPVTLTASLLLFALYALYTRRIAWLYVFALLAMACKEEIPFLIASLGLWSMFFQQRWRTGLGLLLLATAWSSLAFFVIHLSSPIGHSLVLSRYAYLGHNPLQIAYTLFVHPITILKQHFLEPAHRTYLATLFAPAGYLPLLAPWVLILALPTLALNLLSSDPTMYSGLFQYNAELVPILIFSTIESIVLIIWLTQHSYQIYITQFATSHRDRGDMEGCKGALGCQNTQVSLAGTLKTERGTYTRLLNKGLLLLLLSFVLFSTLYQDHTHSAMPFARDFRWPQITTHGTLAQRFIDMIPPMASLSAQTRLVPHVSQRPNIYMFPYADNQADYIFLDVTGDKYPFSATSQAYSDELIKVLRSGNYGILASGDGYLLLKRGLPPLSAMHYTAAQAPPSPPTDLAQAQQDST